jgi:uncharacterized membrane protein
MPWLPISSPTGVLATLSGVCAFFFWLEKATAWRFFQFIPPLIFIYLAPMILSNTGVLPPASPVYDLMQYLILPMLLGLLLLKLNMRGAVRILGAGFGNAIPQAANCVLGEVIFRVRVADRLVGAELSNIQQQRQAAAFLRRLPYVQ